ncbi:MAG: LamG domain-containing protein, partial [Deltaproteobacteria bacterium]|nr:LamG domain-containing protein [Deltaproteobacteria bacterium]
SSSAVESLKEGSIELWVKFDKEAAGIQGILSRDAIYQENGGHITLARFESTVTTPSTQVLAGRLQAQITPESNEAESIACAKASSLHTWHHVVVTFGSQTSSPPHDDVEIYVDGVKGTNKTSKRYWLDCTHGVNQTTKGIAGNDNPWVLGASTNSSTEGKANNLGSPFVGAIDDLRIHKKRILP